MDQRSKRKLKEEEKRGKSQFGVTLKSVTRDISSNTNWYERASDLLVVDRWVHWAAKAEILYNDSYTAPGGMSDSF